MTDLLSRRLALLDKPEHLDLLRHCRHGLEKESLRVAPTGELALTPHPRALGSALTHPQITTDYSEALLEFITAAEEDPTQTLAELDTIHRYAYSQIGDEMLWCQSMPSKLPDEADIPIAEYGSSHTGRIKHVYRKGLAVRYGKAMQCIAGIHYNFSLPEALWPRLQQAEDDRRPTQEYQSENYIALIRNFRRYSWLLMYLFGASPAVCKGFLKDRLHDLDTLDENTLYLPWATSLRMSDLGYQNNAQASIQPCYDGLESYLDSLREAVSTPYPPYVAIGTQQHGEWIQLNTNVLQIENEYYSTIRPKRVACPGERPIQALGSRGVQYVEVRCLDIDPFMPLGIDITTSRFLDTFLLYCALEDSPVMPGEECRECTDNFGHTVKEGRRPGMTLHQHGHPRELVDWGLDLIERMVSCAALLDDAHGGDLHRQALEAQRAKLHNPELTPSARVLHSMSKGHLSFYEFSMKQSKLHAQAFRARPLDSDTKQAFDHAARDSLERQKMIEDDQTGSFEDYVASYMAAIDPDYRTCS